MEEIPELRNAGQEFDRVAPGPLYTQHMHALAAIDPADGVASVQHDFRLDPGQTLTGTVLDPAGKPLSGTHYRGRAEDQAELIGWDLLGSDTFTVDCYRADKPRRLLFVHLGRKFAGSLTVAGPQTAPLRVRLQPWGAISGRVVDAQGKPVSGVNLLDASGTLPLSLLGKDRSGEFPGISYRIVDDGRFCIEGLAPGVKYNLFAAWDKRGNEHEHFGPLVVEMTLAARKFREGPLITDESVASGETKDLGDLHVGRFPQPKWPAPPARAKKAPATCPPPPPGATAAAGGKKQESRPQMERGHLGTPAGELFDQRQSGLRNDRQAGRSGGIVVVLCSNS